MVTATLQGSTEHLPAHQLGREVSLVQRQVRADSGAGSHFPTVFAEGLQYLTVVGAG